MEEHHQGVWIPKHIMEQQARGELGPNEVLLLAIIHSLSNDGQCCLVSNARLAKRLGVGGRRVRQILSGLRERGLITQIVLDDNTRVLGIAGEAINCRGGNKLPGPCLKPFSLKTYNKQLSGTAIPDDLVEKGGFKRIPPTRTKATQFDKDTASVLEAAVRARPARKTGITQAKPSTWANHIRLLRVRDKISEEDIRDVMGWYVKHMGGQYVSEAYSGEAFRRKFHAIERQCKRDLVGAVQPSPKALAMVERLAGLGWPKGSVEELPAAVQICLTNYEAWLARLTEFVDRLCKDDLSNDYGRERGRLLKFGEYLVHTMPGPEHFTFGWMEEVHHRVLGWGGWNGKFAPLLYHPGAKRFRALGREWARGFAHDPDRWDKFRDVMDTEVTEGVDENS